MPIASVTICNWASVLALSLLLIGSSANAIVIRHDVPDARYLVSRQSLLAPVDLPFEGHGTLIASRWVVTAAHAVKFMKSHADASYVTINGKRRDVAKIILYPDYEVSSEAWNKLFDQLKSGDAVAWKKRYDDAMASMHDIALLELKEPVEEVSPIALYRGSAESGQVVEIYGAGASALT